MGLSYNVPEEIKANHKYMRVSDGIIVVEMSPVIFPANEMSVFVWVCGLLISCLKEEVLVGGVCMETPYESHGHTHF